MENRGCPEPLECRVYVFLELPLVLDLAHVRFPFAWFVFEGRGIVADAPRANRMPLYLSGDHFLNSIGFGRGEMGAEQRPHP